ncbi:MAG: PTS lactose/cellobiose transporter subunit IIA [Faecalicoccus sp.]|uniref:PTS lactose/cellobiose transporter subunit IIA n=1 Tax=Faecalicoccus sp. TaxID=1971758 RepID=UPI002F92E55B
MNEIQNIAFQVISNVGLAKSLYIEIIDRCEKKDFENIDAMFEEADEYLIAGHKAHMNFVKMEAQGENIEFSMLAVHAEDQLMNAELVKFLAEKFYKLYRRL